MPALAIRLSEIGVDEIVVVDGGSDDGTPDFAATFADLVLVSERGRGTQIATGADAARGDILWILHADCLPPRDARAEIIRTLKRPNAALGCFPLRFDSRNPLLALYAFASRFDGRFTTFGDQGYFLQRTDYIAAGGVPDWPLFEDVELRRRITRIGRVYKTTARMVTSSRRFDAVGVLRQQVVNFALLSLLFLGAPANRLARFYRGSPPEREDPGARSGDAAPESENARRGGGKRA